MSSLLQARSPGKLILSGEHAVLYGCPALAMAIDRYAQSSVSNHFSPKIFFNLLNLQYAKSFTLNTLRGLKQRLLEQYHAFLEGQVSIREVLKMPFELLQFTVTHFFETWNIPLSQGLEIRSASNIPIGCGMGSSAAAVMSTLYALAHFFKLDIDPVRYLSLGKEAENLQHGRSSGLDLQLVLKGGCLKFEEGKVEARSLPQFPITLVNTGIPQTTTGQCVAEAATWFQHAGLKEAFLDVTLALDKALATNDLQEICYGVRENHRLLQQIQVVPETVRSFIKAIENQGGAAKICGAGAIRGDAAGVVWIVGDPDFSVWVKNFAIKFGLTLETVMGDELGTRLV